MNLQTFLIVNTILNIFCFVSGYYISHRGIKGVYSDLDDVRMDVKNLAIKVKAKV